MTIQPVTYRGRLVAVCTQARFVLAEDLERRRSNDPERIFVVFMCAYAGIVLRGEIPGSYRDEDARRYARACMIPAELLERPSLDVARAASALHLPPAELHAAIAHHRATHHA